MAEPITFSESDLLDSNKYTQLKQSKFFGGTRLFNDFENLQKSKSQTEQQLKSLEGIQTEADFIAAQQAGKVGTTNLSLNQYKSYLGEQKNALTQSFTKTQKDLLDALNAPGQKADPISTKQNQLIDALANAPDAPRTKQLQKEFNDLVGGLPEYLRESVIAPTRGVQQITTSEAQAALSRQQAMDAGELTTPETVSYKNPETGRIFDVPAGSEAEANFKRLGFEQAEAGSGAAQVDPTKGVQIPTGDDERGKLLQRVSAQVLNNGDNVQANESFINATFQALHGRDANAEELQRFSGKGLESTYNAIKAGIPKFQSGSLADFSGTAPSKISLEQGVNNVAIQTGMTNAGSLYSGRTNPGQMLQKFGGDLADTILNDTEKFLSSFLSIRNAEIQDKLGPLEKEKADLKAKLGESLDSNYLETRQKELLNDPKITSLMDALDTNRQRMMNEITSRDLGLQAIDAQPVAATIVLGQKRVLQEQATARIGALSMENAMLRDNADLALSISDRVFSAIKLDRDEQLGALGTLLELADNDIVRLDEDEKTNVEQQISLIEQAQQRLDDNKDKVRDLILDDAEVASAAGITLTDTIDEALGKITKALSNPSSAVSKLYVKRETLKRSGSSGSGTSAKTNALLEAYLFQDEDGTYQVDLEAINDIVSSKDRQDIFEAVYEYARELNNPPEPDFTPGPQQQNVPPNPLFTPGPQSTAVVPENVAAQFSSEEDVQQVASAASNIFNWLNQSYI